MIILWAILSYISILLHRKYIIHSLFHSLSLSDTTSFPRFIDIDRQTYIFHIHDGIPSPPFPFQLPFQYMICWMFTSPTVKLSRLNNLCIIDFENIILFCWQAKTRENEFRKSANLIHISATKPCENRFPMWNPSS